MHARSSHRRYGHRAWGKPRFSVILLSKVTLSLTTLFAQPCLTLIADTLVRESLDRPHNADPLGLLSGNGATTSSSLGVGPAIDAELEAIVYVLKVIGSRSPLVYRQAVLVDAARNAAVREHHHQQQEQGGSQQQQQGQSIANPTGSISPPVPPLQHQLGAPLQMISFTAGLA